ncbi:WD40-repeat-containing domain protein [Blastocladiella britannica]|nr:WD40-repeat-containing domain protein [Blastocladiella britannica]
MATALQIRPGGPKLHDRITPDVRYWSKYRKPTLLKETAAFVSLHFAEASPNLLAATLGSKVQIYHPSTHEVAKTITRFSDLAFSGNLRSDGKLMVAGDEAGGVSVFEMGSRSVLRQFTGHSSPVHLTRFSPNKTQVISGSDDNTVRVWDIPSNACINEFADHTDYVRAGATSRENHNLIATGSYDHTVKLWDLRTNSAVMTLDHGAPVESTLFYRGSNALVSSGGPYFKVFDIVAGGRVLHHVSNHQKTIMSMAFDHSGSRLLTGSLDQSVKIYNVATFKVVHTLKYPSPVLALAVSPNDTHMAVGMLDGTLSLRSRDVKATDVRQEDALAKSYRTGSYKYFMRGEGYQPTASDFQVERVSRPKMNPYDVYLRKFEYASALDVVFVTGQPPIVVVTVLEELMDRGGLERAVSGRTEESLGPLLQFLMRNITHPHFSSTLAEVTHVVLDIYAAAAAHSELLQTQLSKIADKLQEERRVVQGLAKLVGAVDLLLASSSMTSELQVTWKESDEEIIRRVVDQQTEQSLRAAEERMRLMDSQRSQVDGGGDDAMDVDGPSEVDEFAVATSEPQADTDNGMMAEAAVSATAGDDDRARASRGSTTTLAGIASTDHSSGEGDEDDDYHGLLARIERGETLDVSFGGEWSTEQARDAAAAAAAASVPGSAGPASPTSKGSSSGTNDRSALELPTAAAAVAAALRSSSSSVNATETPVSGDDQGAYQMAINPSAIADSSSRAAAAVAPGSGVGSASGSKKSSGGGAKKTKKKKPAQK